MADQSPEEERIGKEQSKSEYKIDDPSGIQQGTLIAVAERLRNFANRAVANKDLREMGKPNIPSSEEDLDDLLSNLESFYTNIEAASILLQNNGAGILPPSPTNAEMPDLFMTDYRRILTKQNSTSEHK